MDPVRWNVDLYGVCIEGRLNPEVAKESISSSMSDSRLVGNVSPDAETRQNYIPFGICGHSVPPYAYRVLDALMLADEMIHCSALIFVRTCKVDMLCWKCHVISGVERGRRNPRITVLQRITQALGADIDDLVKRRT
jgi:hypothetical protein